MQDMSLFSAKRDSARMESADKNNEVPLRHVSDKIDFARARKLAFKHMQSVHQADYNMALSPDEVDNIALLM